MIDSADPSQPRAASAPALDAPAVTGAGDSRWQRALLPGSLRGEGDVRRSARDWIVDVTAILIAIGIGSLLLAQSWDGHSTLARVLDVVLGVAAIVALWWRRERPFELGVLTGLAGTFFALPAGPALIALFSAVIRVSPRQLVVLGALGVFASCAFPLIYPDSESYTTDLAFGLLFTVVVFGWALFVRAKRDLMRALQARAAQSESEQRLRLEQAREAERRRIAREMHDVLAHRVSLLSLHAGALEFHPDAPPAEIAAAAGVVRANARAVLEDLREVIGVLREDAGAAGGGGGGSGGAGGLGAGAGGFAAATAPEPPQPTLARIPALVEQSRAAGMRVECRIALGPLADAEIGAALGRTAYRVVQEGLTNARKHAPGAAAEVVVEGEAAGAAVGGEVAEGASAARSPEAALPGAAGGADAAPVAPVASPRLVVVVTSRPAVGTSPAASGDAMLPGAGIGLSGLAERVALAGGELSHGRDARGDFVLRATLPWTRAAA